MTTRTFTVTVQNVSGYNKYFIDGVQQDTLTLAEGGTYVFNWSADYYDDEDVMIVGDYNADCSYFDEEDSCYV